MPEFLPSAAARARGEEVAKLRKQIADVFAAHRAGDGYDMPAEKIAEIRGLNDEVAAKAAAYEALLGLERSAHDNEVALRGLTDLRSPMAPEPIASAAPARNMREILASKAADLRALGAGGSGKVTFDLSEVEAKTITLANIAPQADRQPIVPSAQFLADVTDLFTPGTTDSDTLDWYEETTFTNAAAETAEATAAPESAINFTLRTGAVREIVTWVPVSRRALSDVAGLASYVEGRLGHMVALRRSSQLLNGNGTPPNLRGILATSGIQTRARGTDPIPDAVYRAIVLARTTGDAEPTGFVVHANDWADVRLLRTIDGLYIWGSPSEVGPDRIWGLATRQSNSIAENTGLVGAFRPFAQVFRREGLTIEVSTEHASMFTERRAAILAYERLALVVYRPAAFVSVTGI